MLSLSVKEFFTRKRNIKTLKNVFYVLIQLLYNSEALSNWLNFCLNLKKLNIIWAFL